MYSPGTTDRMLYPGIDYWCHSGWIIPIMAFGFFYLWYGIEYLIILAFAGWDKQNDRYHDVSFEEEAHSNDTKWDYLKERSPFSWMSYIKLRSYKK